LLNDLVIGFSVSFQYVNLFCCFAGVLIGQVIGILPGIGPVGAMSLLMPITYYLQPVSAIIMLSGIYYGAQYGGSVTSILLNIPGEATTVVTCLDGYQMARKGRAGIALGISAIGSFIAGTLGICGLVLLAYPLAKFGLRLGAPEYFSLVLFGITLIIYMASESMLRALISAVLGLWVGTIGLDTMTSIPRFSFGSLTLLDGVGLVPIAMGLFGVSEVLLNIEQSIKRDIYKERIGNLLPTIRDFLSSAGAIIRGTLIGFFLGIIPGGGALLASFFSYGLEKRISKHPEEFGKGAIEGVAGPESANNAGAQGAFIPLLTLGIPSNVIMAMLLGTLMIHGVKPGPLLLSQNPKLFWGVITSMYVGNIILLILNIPLIALWVKILKIPYYILFPLILLFCVIGVYSLNNNEWEIYILILFGALGYVLRKLRFEVAPFVLALVLGPLLEENLRQSLVLSGGKISIFFTQPISLLFLLITIFLLSTFAIPKFKKKRRGLIETEDDL
jgi:putative tricarboxylic transport membrane protein